jgi:peptidoglycan hydrolase CwlO-like protein
MDWLEMLEINMKHGHNTANIHARQLISKVREQQKEIEGLQDKIKEQQEELEAWRNDYLAI